jgi:hypothetical protein
MQQHMGRQIPRRFVANDGPVKHCRAQSPLGRESVSAAVASDCCILLDLLPSRPRPFARTRSQPKPIRFRVKSRGRNGVKRNNPHINDKNSFYPAILAVCGWHPLRHLPLINEIKARTCPLWRAGFRLVARAAVTERVHGAAYHVLAAQAARSGPDIKTRTFPRRRQEDRTKEPGGQMTPAALPPSQLFPRFSLKLSGTKHAFAMFSGDCLIVR